MVDVIAELINSLKTASAAGKTTATFPYSKMREAVLLTLEKEGFIKSFTKKGKKVIKTIEVELVYDDAKKPKIQGAEQVSKYSRRLYYKSTELYPVRNGYGALVITTPKGVMTGKAARKEKVGGEPLFKIW